MADPKKRWQRLADAAAEDDVEAAAAVSVAEAERDLAAAGFDVKAERARAEALIAELMGEAAPAKGAPESATEPTAWEQAAASPARKPAPSRVLWLAAALLAAAVAGGALYAAAHRPTPPEKPIDVPSATASAPSPPVPVVPSGTKPRPSGPPVDSKLPPP